MEFTGRKTHRQTKKNSRDAPNITTPTRNDSNLALQTLMKAVEVRKGHHVQVLNLVPLTQIGVTQSVLESASNSTKLEIYISRI